MDANNGLHAAQAENQQLREPLDAVVEAATRRLTASPHARCGATAGRLPIGVGVVLE